MLILYNIRTSFKSNIISIIIIDMQNTNMNQYTQLKIFIAFSLDPIEGKSETKITVNGSLDLNILYNRNTIRDGIIQYSLSRKNCTNFSKHILVPKGIVNITLLL